MAPITSVRATPIVRSHTAAHGGSRESAASSSRRRNASAASTTGGGGTGGIRGSLRAQVLHRHAELVGEPRGDQRAVAGLGVALDAQERRCAARREARDEGIEIGLVEDLARVARHVTRRELGARALANALARVLGVLETA